MGTRAQITVKTETGFRSVYLHWDGYPEGALVTLRKHYSTPERAAELVALGDMSVLSERCNGSARHCFDYPEPGQCVFYGRDRGEPWERVRPKDTAALEPLQADEEYWYLFDGEAWGEVEESDIEESNAGNEDVVSID